uniref:Uncharacterized protein n=1 Tax=Arundo donax TaxID=35708 RepID=A0A0A9CS79_ARUDO
MDRNARRRLQFLSSFSDFQSLREAGQVSEVTQGSPDRLTSIAAPRSASHRSSSPPPSAAGPCSSRRPLLSLLPHPSCTLLMTVMAAAGGRARLDGRACSDGVVWLLRARSTMVPCVSASSAPRWLGRTRAGRMRVLCSTAQ